MGDISSAGHLAFRDYVTDAVPSSGAHQPVKAAIRGVFDMLDEGAAGAISVKWPAYGAEADNTTDDGPAFNLALAAGPTAIVPPGTYRIATNVVVPANTTLIIMSGVILNLEAKLVPSGDHSAIVGPECAMNPDDATGLAVIHQTNGANLARMIEVSGDNVCLQNILLIGNKANNASAGSGIYITGNRASVIQSMVKDCKTHGIHVYSAPTSNAACCGYLRGSTSYNNGGSGFYCEQSADFFVTQCEFEANGAHGIECNNSPTMRVCNSDMGGNTGRGFYAYGQAYNVGVSLGANGHLITNNQFGNNNTEDIFLDGGHDGGGASLNGTYANVITGNSFIGSQTRTDATYACIRIKDNGSGGNVVTGNNIVSVAGHTFTYGIKIEETTSGNEGYDVVMGNVAIGTLATAMAVGTGKTFIFNWYAGAGVVTGLTAITNALKAGSDSNSLQHTLLQGHDSQAQIYSDTANEVVIDAGKASDSGATKYNLNLNKYGGGYLMGNGAANLGNYADDAAAASGSIAVGQLYRTGSIVKIRAA